MFCPPDWLHVHDKGAIDLSRPCSNVADHRLRESIRAWLSRFTTRYTTENVHESGTSWSRIRFAVYTQNINPESKLSGFVMNALKEEGPTYIECP